MNPFSFQHKLGHIILSWIQHYNHEKYWKRRAVVTNPQDKTNLLLKFYYLDQSMICDGIYLRFC